MIQVMSGAATFLILWSCCHAFAYDDIEPPLQLNIAVPTLGKVVLTWKHSVAPQNKSVKYMVKVSTPENTKETKTSNNYSTHYMVALHRGYTAQVAVQIYDPQDDDFLKTSKWASKDLPPYPGAQRTSAIDLSCQIDIEASENCSLSCNWVPGDKAPADTEYNLYYRYDNMIERCQNYITEPGGQRRIGCCILSKVISINSPQNILIHINGTSKSLKIKAMEKIFYSSDIEIIPPIQKLTVDVNGLHWMKPNHSLSETCFNYEVNIRSKGRNETITVEYSTYVRDDLHKSSGRQFIRVRTIGKLPCWSPNRYSPWTDIIHVGEDVLIKDFDRSYILGIIVSVCLIVAFVVIFLLCIRFWGHIFPQIPKPKNDLKEAFQNLQSQALMRCNSWDNEEVISYIEELVESDKYKMSSDYAHSADYSFSGLCKPV